VTIGDSFADVLAKAQAGDHPAFATIYTDVSPLVLGYLRMNRVRDAEDVAGEVFLSLVRQIGRFDGDETAFRSWLLTITYRRMVDHFRRGARRLEDAMPMDELGKRLGGVSSSEVEAIERLRAGGIVEAMDQLSELQRSAISLRVLADLPVREISQVMGKPESTVKALLRRGSASLGRAVRAG
jgi:RNA polymerase sigma-70 factor (ECF subfamily)